VRVRLPGSGLVAASGVFPVGRAGACEWWGLERQAHDFENRARLSFVLDEIDETQTITALRTRERVDVVDAT
jgi:hypothetical protein